MKQTKKVLFAGIKPFLFLILTGLPLLLQAQWTNRYPKVEGYGHHIYSERMVFIYSGDLASEQGKSGVGYNATTPRHVMSKHVMYDF